MKKTIKIVLVLFILSIFVLPTMINATTISQAEYKNGKITITGTGVANETIQIVLFDASGNPKYLTTTNADGNGDFNITLPEISGLTEGTYTIKTGSYSGANISTKSLEITDVSGKDNTPKTGYDAIYYVLAFAIVASLTVVILKNNKKMMNEENNKVINK